MRRTPATFFVSLLVLTACASPEGDPEPDPLADFPEGVLPDDDGVSPASDDFADELDPQQIVGGLIFDDERAVKVLNAHVTEHCSGTLLRNDVVLTARHCVTTDGFETGPLAEPNMFALFQDGPGDQFQGLAFVAEVEEIGVGLDVALLRLSNNLSIDGFSTGESTELWSRPADELLGDVVLCMGYGMTTCGVPGGFLRAGLSNVHAVVPSNGTVNYKPYGNTPWLPTFGDSGSSCRVRLGNGFDLRAIGVVSTGDACTPLGGNNPTSYSVHPDLFRDLVQAKMVEWDGPTFVNTYNAAGPSFVVEPPGNPATPYATMWFISGGRLYQFYDDYAHDPQTEEGTKYIHTAEVLENGSVSATAFSHETDVVGLIARMRDDTHYYRFSVDESAQQARIVMRVGSAFTELASASTSGVDFSNTPTLEFHLDGNMLTGFIDGTPVVSATDSDWTYLAGRTGLYTYAMSGAAFDDFEIARE